MQTSPKISEQGFGIYVHWPFCRKKCPYCDFNSHVREEIDHDLWAKSLCDELQFFADKIDQKQMVTSVFFGGGTPSLMKPKTVEKILKKIQKLFDVSPTMEVTLEANPTSSEAQKFKDFKKIGINRLSIGVQALNDTDLKFLGREHSVKEALQAVDLAAQIFDRFSFDLMYGRPNQSPEKWEAELQKALEYAVGHISLYQLTIEQGTQFETRYKRGDFNMPSSDEEAVLYDLTAEVLSANGFDHYEVSNFAKSGQKSLHNLVYWRYGEYIGIGPGAHGRLMIDGKKQATRTHRAPEIWLEKVQTQGHATHPFESIGHTQILTEVLMMGLRLKEGIPLNRIIKETGKELNAFIDQKKLNQMCNEGYLLLSDDILKATPEGRRTLNAVIGYLL